MKRAELILEVAMKGYHEEKEHKFEQDGVIVHKSDSILVQLLEQENEARHRKRIPSIRIGGILLTSRNIKWRTKDSCHGDY